MLETLIVTGILKNAAISIITVDFFENCLIFYFVLCYLFMFMLFIYFCMYVCMYVPFMKLESLIMKQVKLWLMSHKSNFFYL